MEKTVITQANSSPYEGCCVVLPTKHQKSIALAPPFEQILGAGMLEYVVDTDRLGTFSGEIKRHATAIETAKKKCLWAINRTKAKYVLASEGSFGPHPMFPFLPMDHEILYFVDQRRDFHLHISSVCTDTNYHSSEIASLDDLKLFAEKSQFPSHALIVKPFSNDEKKPIYKGILTYPDLEAAFFSSIKYSSEGKVWVETDMRAHLNPTRMRVINLLGETLAQRLMALCPKCATPGWGKVDFEAGLPCGWCGAPTDEIKCEILGCSKCHHSEFGIPSHGMQTAEPIQCAKCNP